MVGRLDEELRRTLLFYYYSLVMGDAESAARYLSAVAEAGPGGDAVGFRREVTEISQRWRLAPSFESFSLGQLILASGTRGAQYGMYFPVEGADGDLDLRRRKYVLLPERMCELSRRHIRRVFLQQFSPIRPSKPCGRPHVDRCSRCPGG
jgi:ubiquinone biosynthesis protein